MKKKVLMIDDEEDFCFFTKKNLEKTREFEVVIENNPLNAVQTAAEQKPDVILLDIIMPQLDGGEVAFRLVNDNRTKDTPIIFLTCLAEEKDLGRYDGLSMVGGRPFIAKPCQASELARVIKEVLERK
ncbi:MAG: response regulator [Candidatus Omnitrophica bacterium]|nr:response regulator [Candidatus Omnitrophota bacterium]